MKLNLGCGDIRLDGWQNVDAAGSVADMLCDLNQTPWPWKSDSVDEILMSHCLEHLDNPVSAIHEMARILKPRGRLEVRVPNYLWPLAALPYHKTFWSFQSMACFTSDSKKNCGEHLFDAVNCRHVFYAIRWPACPILNVVANIFPVAWEYLHLPVMEVKWVGVKAVR